MSKHTKLSTMLGISDIECGFLFQVEKRNELECAMYGGACDMRKGERKNGRTPTLKPYQDVLALVNQA